MPAPPGSTVLYLALGVSSSLIREQQPKEQSTQTGGSYVSWEVDPLGLV